MFTRHGALTRCCFNVGPPSKPVGQHLNSTGFPGVEMEGRRRVVAQGSVEGPTTGEQSGSNERVSCSESSSITSLS